MTQSHLEELSFGRILKLEKSGDELFLDFTELAQLKGWKDGDTIEFVKTERGVEIFKKESD